MEVSELIDVATGYWKSAALMAALELGVFDTLVGGPTSLADVGQRTGTSPEYLGDLLGALAGLGIVIKGEGGYSLPTEVQQLLDPEHPDSLIPALRFNSDLYPLWGGLARCVRDGRPIVPPDAHLGDNPERTLRFVQAMHSRARLFTPLFKRELDLTGVGNLLDLACGPGTFGLALAEEYTELHLTLFDLPPILRAAKAIQVDHPAIRRARFCPGDYHADELPAGFDAVLYSGALHQESRDDAHLVIEKTFDTLVPGGRLYVFDLMLDRDGVQPTFSALFSLQMRLTRPHGHVYSIDAVIRLVKEAGFDNIRSKTLRHTPYGLVCARKPVG
jgi:3-hydroxy-5-methyl-1-naphthoate 3-O-methyltransferase